MLPGYRKALIHILASFLPVYCIGQGTKKEKECEKYGK